jgi:hypothetical protein
VSVSVSIESRKGGDLRVGRWCCGMRWNGDWIGGREVDWGAGEGRGKGRGRGMGMGGGFGEVGDVMDEGDWE